jgi:hypothetical protein
MKQSVVALSGSRLTPRMVPATTSRRSVIRRYKEGDSQAQKEVQGGNAPKNPITGQPLERVTNVQKEGYQAAEQIPQGQNARARIDQQLEAQPGGRDFFEIQAFDGLGPEVINSRLAMLGFAIAAFFELTTGKDVFQQVKDYPLITIATFVIFISASWIPFQKGQAYNVKSGPFTPALEVTLGRIAMLGFSGLVLNEAYLGHAFFPRIFG